MLQTVYIFLPYITATKTAGIDKSDVTVITLCIITSTWPVLYGGWQLISEEARSKDKSETRKRQIHESSWSHPRHADSTADNDSADSSSCSQCSLHPIAV